jgi:hypothetical protein
VTETNKTTKEITKEKQMRDYRVTKTNHKNGEVHSFNGKLYKRLYTFGAAFDHEVGPEARKAALKEFEEGWKLFKTNKKAYFEKYGPMGD